MTLGGLVIIIIRPLCHKFNAVAHYVHVINANINLNSYYYLCTEGNGQDTTENQEYCNDAKYDEILKNRQKMSL